MKATSTEEKTSYILNVIFVERQMSNVHLIRKEVERYRNFTKIYQQFFSFLWIVTQALGGHRLKHNLGSFFTLPMFRVYSTSMEKLILNFNRYNHNFSECAYTLNV